MNRTEIIERLTEDFAGLSPQMRLAAKTVLDKPEEVAISSMRSLAATAGVAPATMLRLARSLGFSSYDSFRASFQEALRTQPDSFASRAEWLQSLAGEDASGRVLSGMAEAQLGNIEAAYKQLDPAGIAAAADCLRKAQTVYVVGIAALHGIMRHFHFVCRFALPQMRLVMSDNSEVIDELLSIGGNDALIAMTVEPYARQSVEAVTFAKERGAQIVVLTDSRGSPAAGLADHLLLAPTRSPQFFPSITAALAVLESLSAMIVSRGKKSTVERIAKQDQLRAERGIYWTPEKEGGA